MNKESARRDKNRNLSLVRDVITKLDFTQREAARTKNLVKHLWEFPTSLFQTWLFVIFRGSSLVRPFSGRTRRVSTKGVSMIRAISGNFPEKLLYKNAPKIGEIWPFHGYPLLWIPLLVLPDFCALLRTFFLANSDLPPYPMVWPLPRPWSETMVSIPLRALQTLCMKELLCLERPFLDLVSQTLRPRGRGRPPPWWEFRPRKKIFSPHPPQIPCKHPPGPSPPCPHPLGRPPPSL